MNPDLILHKHGAEAKLYFYNQFAIKHRISKSYRLKTIDTNIITKRTRTEEKIMKKLNANSINTPKLYTLQDIPELNVFNINDTLVMQKIDGITLLEYLIKATDNIKEEIFSEMGKIVSQIHKLNIIHGDMTPANFMVQDGKLVVVDFGLACMSRKNEDKAVDLYVFERALLCIQHERFLKSFYGGYQGDDLGCSNEVMSRLDTVRLRGRKREECTFG